MAFFLCLFAVCRLVCHRKCEVKVRNKACLICYIRHSKKFLFNRFCIKMNVCNTEIVLWDSETENKVVSLQNFPKWLCLLVQVRLLSNPPSHFCLETKQILSKRTFFFLDSGQAPLVEEGYWRTLESKKQQLHAVPWHVWLGQLIPCSRILSPKLSPSTFPVW